jgi:hypothetical protein
MIDGLAAGTAARHGAAVELGWLLAAGRSSISCAWAGA